MKLHVHIAGVVSTEYFSYLTILFFLNGDKKNLKAIGHFVTPLTTWGRHVDIFNFMHRVQVTKSIKKDYMRACEPHFRP